MNTIVTYVGNSLLVTKRPKKYHFHKHSFNSCINTMIQFIKSKSILFPNNEIFFITGDKEGDSCFLNLPECYFEELKKFFSRYSCGDILKETSQQEMIVFISRLLSISGNEIKIHNSINYEYRKNTISVSPGNSACYNKEIDMGKLPDTFDTDSKIFSMFTEYPYATAVMDKDGILSFCGTYNGALCIETHPDHRKKGYATQCLQLLVHKLLTESNYKRISFPTTVDNTASRRVAEKSGFVEADRGIWIAVNTDISKLDEDFLKNCVERVDQ